MRGDLQCPHGCEGGRFEALNAPLFVDRQGRYLDHDDSQATFVCAVCQSVAIDTTAVGRAMAIAGEAGVLVLVCPSCGVEMLPPEDPLAAIVECPACETAFTIEEGQPRLHGTGVDPEEF